MQRTGRRREKKYFSDPHSLLSSSKNASLTHILRSAFAHVSALTRIRVAAAKSLSDPYSLAYAGAKSLSDPYSSETHRV
jgi:hypothetical protein